MAAAGGGGDGAEARVPEGGGGEECARPGGVGTGARGRRGGCPGRRGLRRAGRCPRPGALTDAHTEVALGTPPVQHGPSADPAVRHSAHVRKTRRLRNSLNVFCRSFCDAEKKKPAQPPQKFFQFS